MRGGEIPPRAMAPMSPQGTAATASLRQLRCWLENHYRQALCPFRLRLKSDLHSAQTLRALYGRIEQVSRTEIRGWAWDPRAPDEHIRIEMVEGKNV